jgi:hypothetical protein
MASLMGVIGFVFILLSIFLFRGTGFVIFLAIWAALTAVAYAYEWKVEGVGGKSWFSSRPFMLCCWLGIVVFTLLRMF